MRTFSNTLPTPKSVIGMIHLQALPGTPKYQYNSTEFILEKAVEEAICYKKAGVDAIMIENMHDVPYMKNDVGHEISAMMAVIARAIKKASELPCGVQVLAAANKAALAVALAGNLDFIRAEGFVFGHLADEGYIDSNAAELLRYRKMINAEHIAVFTDIKKKHSSHAISQDVDVLETAKAAEFFLTDGLIITGSSTGETADLQILQRLFEQRKSPVLVGSGVTIDNVEHYLPFCDAMIVGSHFKKDGYWEKALDADRIKRFMNKVNQLRSVL